MRIRTSISNFVGLRDIQFHYKPINLAELTGLEPATFSVTGKYANQLHLSSINTLVYLLNHVLHVVTIYIYRELELI